MKNNDDIVAKRLKELRAKSNLTMEQVADKIGVSKSTIAKWENGYVANMKRDKIAALAKLYKVPPLYVSGYVEDDISEEEYKYEVERQERQDQKEREDAIARDLFMKEFQERLNQQSESDKERFLARITTIYNALNYSNAEELLKFAEFLQYKEYQDSKSDQ